MNSKERVMTAMNHQEPDKCPVDFWATEEIKDRLKEHWNIDSEEEMLQRVGCDVRIVRGPSYAGQEFKKFPDGSVADLWGVRRIVVEYGKDYYKGSYKEVVESPLEKMTSLQEIENYEGWPSADWWDYSKVGEECAQFEGKCIINVGDRLDRTAQLKPAMYLRGIQQIMEDMVFNPAIAEAIFERVAAYFLEYNSRVFPKYEGKIDIFMMGDDFGMQNQPLMSVEMWRKYFKKNFRKYIDLAHKYGFKVMHHTCGAVRPLIPDFIDCGLDILQSLQPMAKGMDLGELKREFGKDLAFQGGVCIQETLPRGTKEDVRNMVKKLMEAGKPGGGYMICSAHNIQPDTKLENVLALLDAYQEFRDY
ncbi:MAG: hypothetical protein GX334_06110 [Firmicutes bacterium]|nr:hypothetical protein [Bacillota bacterium]